MPEVIFNGAEGRIEGKYHHSSQNNPPVALVLHPHPVHGGTMNNKVVYNLYKTLSENGFSVLRFNFRGVGKSQGTYDNGIGELTDAATALDWLQLQNPQSSTYWIVGFSFGAWISLQLLMRRPEISNFIAISPPAGKYDFSFLTPCPSPGLIVQGDKDTVVAEKNVFELVEKLSNQKNSSITYEIVKDADHFFREQIEEFNQIIDEYIKEQLSTNRPKKTKNDKRRKKSFSLED